MNLNKNHKISIQKKTFSDKIKIDLKEKNNNQNIFEDSNSENYKININNENNNNNIRIFKDYFYENSIDKTRILPKSDQKEASLLDIPEYRELYKKFSVVLQNEQLSELDNIKHDVKENDRYYKYGLSVKNEMPFKELIVSMDQKENENLSNTPNQNLFVLLDLDKDSSYESLVLKFRNEFQHG
jgi:hypothetical protein